MKRQQILIDTLVLGLLLTLAAGLGAGSPRVANAHRLLADFNFDGYADLAIGVPYENVGSTTDAGSVNVLYGTSAGLSGTGDDYWQQNYLNGSNAETYEYFGRALTEGDFDGNGYMDLAVGVPYEDVGSVNQAGAVNIIYGSASGLATGGNQYWNQDEPGVAGGAETDDHFGYALAAGDFDGDGYDDLAIGIPDEDIGTVVNAGGVQVMYGSASGITARDKVWNQEGGAETGDRFGKAVAVGDFDNDGYDDLAVGIPSEDLVSIVNSGAVDIFYGSAGGLTTRVSNDFWHQDRTGVPDMAEDHDNFGDALTAGDFDGDGYADLAVGVPYEDVGSPEKTNAGVVHVLYGSSTGIVGADSDYWHQDVSGIGSTVEAEDRFGFALTAGDLNGDGYTDLAVGAPYEHWSAEADIGIVQILYGTASGLTATGCQLWRQDIPDVQGAEEANDRFGYALAAGNFDGDDYADLAIGVPYEDIGTVVEAGAVNVLYGSDSGLTVAGNQLWYQGSGGIQGTAETGDRFGFALAAIPTTVKHKVFLPAVLRNYP